MSAPRSDCPAPERLEEVAIGAPADASLEAHLADCARCRARLDQIVADNRFLLSFASAAESETDPSVALPELRIPGYELLRELHRGGQGVVYHARQQSTKRDVAIKVMRQGPFATLADRARFEREIDTLSRLEHPNIVTVHDAGRAGGFHYFVMPLVAGRPLDEWAADAPPAARRHATPNGERADLAADVLEVFIRVCEAVHAAHLRGIIHRDLKPSNIRVDPSGDPHVLDFGLAKPIDAPRDSAMTQTGQFVGSLPWAAPEQIEGEPARLDIRTDVYSLGVILYQLLTGALPYDVGSNLRSALDNILHHQPAAPSAQRSARRRGSAIDEELDTIVLKCLSKDRERRYQSAGELARDLRRYRAGEPIDAKRDSALYVLRTTLRRYRLRVAAAGAFVVLLVVFAIVMSLLYRRSWQMEQRAVQSAGSLAALLTQSTIEQARMAGLLGDREQAERLLWGELLRSHEPGAARGALHAPPGPIEPFWALWELYRRHPCAQTYATPTAAWSTLTAADDDATVWIAHSSGDVRRMGPDGTVRESFVVENATRSVLSVTANAALIVGLEPDQVRLWRRDVAGAAPQLVARLPVEIVAAGRTGRRFAGILGQQVIVWDTAPFAERARFSIAAGLSSQVALSNDERRVAARDNHGDILIWEIDEQRLLHQARGATAARTSPLKRGALLFSPDDTLLADAWLETPGRIWDLGSDPPRAVELSDRPGDYRALAFRGDSRVLAVGDLNGAMRFFDARTGQRRGLIIAHRGRVRSIEFGDAGRTLWSCGETELRRWDLTPDAGVRIARPTGELFHAVDIDPAGRLILAAGNSGRLQRSLRPGFDFQPVAFGNDITISALAIAPNGQSVAAASYGDAAFVWPGGDLEAPPLRLAHPRAVSHVAFSPDSQCVATACEDRVVRVWRVGQTEPARVFAECGDRIPQVAFDPVRPRIAVAVRSGALLIASLDGDAEPQSWAPASGVPRRVVRFSADGRWLLTGGAGRVLEIWDAAAGTLRAELPGHAQEIFSLDVAADGELIASGDSGGTIRLWHRELGRALATLDGHGGPVMSLRFTPDAQALLSASLDGSVREWNLTYFDQHIAGQLESQLARVKDADAADVAAWREWASAVRRAAAEHARAAEPAPAAAPAPRDP